MSRYPSTTEILLQDHPEIAFVYVAIGIAVVLAVCVTAAMPMRHFTIEDGAVLVCVGAMWPLFIVGLAVGYAFSKARREADE